MKRWVAETRHQHTAALSPARQLELSGAKRPRSLPQCLQSALAKPPFRDLAVEEPRLIAFEEPDFRPKTCSRAIPIKAST